MASIADGLHRKLPTYLQSVVLFTGTQFAAFNALQFALFGFSNPFPTTVMPAPSYAPISVGSSSISAMLPFRLASQPISGSSGSGSATPCCAAGQVYVPVGSYG